MADSLGIEIDENALAVIAQILSDQGAPFQEVIFGTALPKARGLHWGVFWGRSIPERARPILFIHEGLANDVIAAIDAQVEEDQRQGRQSPAAEYAEMIRLVAQADVDERFATAPGSHGGAVYGGEFWVGLSQSYLQKRPDRAGGKLLQDTGELRQSFTSSGQVFKFR